MQRKNIKINDSFIVNALRNCGYNNYSAISDIIDNSLEKEVESSFVKIDFDLNGTGKEATIESIYIIDDGCGMDKVTIEEAMSLGSETGKNGKVNLGMYGAGLKTASFSIGQKLEVFTKTEEGDLNYAIISLEDVIKGIENAEINVCYETFEIGSNECTWFTNMVGVDHGTIIKISKLDKISNKNYYNFKGTLKNKIGENFNKFINANVVKIYVQKDEVPYVNMMGNSLQNELMGEGNFDVEGHNIRYKAWYLPTIGGGNKEDNEHTTMSDGSEYENRNVTTQGLYIYRHNRLVGKAITLGLWIRDPWANGFRCEIFVDGDADYLFGSTFTKMVNESSKGTISQSLIDKLVQNVKPYYREAVRRQEKDLKNKNKNEDPETKKQKEDFYKRVTDSLNGNNMIRAKRTGENKQKEDENKEHTPRGPQKNPNPIKNRTNKWLDGFVEESMGECGNMFELRRKNNKRIIIINTDHEFYNKFYNKLNDELKFKMALVMACDEVAKQNVNYYGSNDVENIINEYDTCKASEVRKAIKFA